MCVLGMAQEFKGSIGVNALWPRTGNIVFQYLSHHVCVFGYWWTILHVSLAIQTAAMEMLGGSGVGKQCRKVEIMADAAYAILSKPVSFTGQFVIDEDILKKEGVKDFDVYAVEPG